MKFVMLYRPAAGDAGGPTPECAARLAGLTDEMTRKGVLLAMGGCMPSAHGAKVRLSEGRASVTDGPFTEAKEVIAGFSLIEAKSREEATGYALLFMELAGDGEVEVRPLFEQEHLEHCAGHAEPERVLAVA